MNYAPFEPLYSDILEKQRKFEINRRKAQHNIKKYVKQNKLIELKSLFYGCDSYYLTTDKQIIKTSNLDMNFIKPSYDEIQNIIEWNPTYFK